MKTKLFMSVAAAALTASMAFAQSSTDNLVAQLQEQGYTRIEIKRGPRQLKVEAIRGKTKREMVYDIATGALLKDEQEGVNSGDDTTPGVEIETESGDFLDDDDDDDNDDYDDDRDDDRDDDDDDRDDEDDDDRDDDKDDDKDDDDDDDDD